MAVTCATPVDTRWADVTIVGDKIPQKRSIFHQTTNLKIMLERQCEGIAKAKREGRYRGRKPTARAKTADVLARHSAGVGASEIARALNIAPASVYRIIAESRAA